MKAIAAVTESNYVGIDVNALDARSLQFEARGS